MTKLYVWLRLVPLFILAVVWWSIHQLTGYRWGALHRYLWDKITDLEDWEARYVARRKAVEVMKRGGNRATRRTKP